MTRFTELYARIDGTTSTNAKVAALVDYFTSAPPADAAWTLFFLTGRRLTRLLPTRLLHEWTIELTGLPEWLVRESYAVTGDFAETMALLLDRRIAPIDPGSLVRAGDPGPAQLPFDDPPALREVDTDVAGVSLAEWIEQRIRPLATMPDDERRRHVIAWWSRMDRAQLFLLNKLLTGEFRVGVSRTLVVRALAQVAGLPPPVVDHRLMGPWEPSAAAFAALSAPAGPADTSSQPYPFCLASPLEQPAADLGDRSDWLAEWKWDGIRTQLIRRTGTVVLWSRGGEPITDRFPEVTAAAAALPEGTVLDGELLAFEQGRPRPFADLQQRIGRTRRVHEVAAGIPVVLVAFDLLEDHGEDVRSRPLRERRARLLALVAAAPPGPGEQPASPIHASVALSDTTWADLAAARADSRRRGVEGLMLKRWASPYHAGRRRGDWWKWKIEPHTIDAVLMYAQPGSGRRASLFTDYTFGVWDGDALVPVAKAYSGLTDAEIDELDRWVRRHTIERFGPVSAVEPVQVFELGFERIGRSSRHRSGVAVRFPRMLRWRRDKSAGEADTLERLTTLLATQDDSLPRR